MRVVKVTKEYRVTNFGEPINTSPFHYINYRLPKALCEHIIIKFTKLTAKERKKITDQIELDIEKDGNYF